jgi:hypothetical protein
MAIGTIQDFQVKAIQSMRYGVKGNNVILNNNESTTTYISNGLVCLHLEKPTDIPTLVFIRKCLCRDTPQLIYQTVKNNLKENKL